MPNKYELYWTVNNRRIQTKPQLIKHNLVKKANKRRNLDHRFYYENGHRIHHHQHSHHHKYKHQRRSIDGSHFDFDLYFIQVQTLNDITTSRLRMNSLENDHRGVYKCHYDKFEVKYELDFEPKCKIYSLKTIKQELNNKFYFNFFL
jgi:hypothetical protein